jgi:hypothetical protein
MGLGFQDEEAGLYKTAALPKTTESVIGGCGFSVVTSGRRQG